MTYANWKVNLVFRPLVKLNQKILGVGLGKSRAAKSLKNKLRHVLDYFLTHGGPLPIDAGGVKMYISHPSAGVSYLSKDRYMDYLFQRVVAPGETVLDIGAQFGYYSLLAARKVGERGKVYAFEPEPANFELLRRNVELWGHRTIITVNKAISDRNDKALLYVADSPGEHSLIQNDLHPQKRAIHAESTTIDTFLKNQPVHVIKIDIEGAEPLALRGAKTTIAQNDRLVIFTEFHPLMLRKGGIDPDSFLRELETMGFQVKIINEQASRLVSISHDVLSNIYSQGAHVNLLCQKHARG